MKISAYTTFFVAILVMCELENMRTMKELKALFAFVESLLSSATLHWFKTLACMSRYILVRALSDFGFMGLRAKRGLDGVKCIPLRLL